MVVRRLPAPGIRDRAVMDVRGSQQPARAITGVPHRAQVYDGFGEEHAAGQAHVLATR
jgi:hypothetical protein